MEFPFPLKGEKMDTFERLYTAISGGVPDRVPVVPKIWVDLGAALTETNLVKVIEDPLTALKVITQAALECKADAVRQFHFPFRKIEESEGRVFEINTKGIRIGEIDMQGGLSTILYDAETFNLEDPAYTAYHHFWSAEKPFILSIEDAQRIAVPDKQYYHEMGCADRQQYLIDTVGSKITLIGDCSSATLAYYVCMRGLARAMFDLIEEKALVHKVMEKGVATAIEKGKFNLDLGIKILRLNDSVGNMNVISPEHWREFVFPHMKEVCDELHQYDPEARIYCHICGNILPIAVDLVKTGIDCIGPIDPLGGMTAGNIRELVGDTVSLMVGVDTLSFINKTCNSLMEEAGICIKEAGSAGGFILGSGCVVPRTSKKESLLCLRKAADTYGIYKNGKLARYRKG